MAQMAVLQPPPSIAYDLREFLRYSHLVPNPAPSLSLGPGDAQTNVSPGIGKRLDMQVRSCLNERLPLKLETWNGTCVE